MRDSIFILVNLIKSLLIWSNTNKSIYFYLRVHKHNDDLIDGMALQPAGVQPNIISLPWVNFSLPRSEHQSLVIASAHWICTTRTRAMISCRSTSHSRRLTRRRLRSLSSFNSQVLFSWTLKFKKLLQYLSYRMFAAYIWSIKYRQKEKLIAQFSGKLRDERFEPN